MQALNNYFDPVLCHVRLSAYNLRRHLYDALHLREFLPESFGLLSDNLLEIELDLAGENRLCLQYDPVGTCDQEACSDKDQAQGKAEYDRADQQKERPRSPPQLRFFPGISLRGSGLRRFEPGWSGSVFPSRIGFLLRFWCILRNLLTCLKHDNDCRDCNKDDDDGILSLHWEPP